MLRHKRHRQRWRTAVIVLSVFGLLIVAFLRCRPVVTAFAESQATWIATDIANQTVASVLNEQADLCRSVITTTYNDQRILSSVFTDTAAINQIRTTVTDRIISRMESVDVISTGIPLGTLMGLDWLSGWGPPIPFRMSVTCGVLSDVSTAVEAVGINQSSYCVSLDVHINIYVVTPGGRSSVAVDVSYPMAEAMLFGEVPNNLTEVYGDDQSLLGKIFDYGTEE